jgi:hypothetical protein
MSTANLAPFRLFSRHCSTMLTTSARRMRMGISPFSLPWNHMMGTRLIVHLQFSVFFQIGGRISGTNTQILALLPPSI